MKSESDRLRVLMLEDDPDDAALVLRELAKILPQAAVHWTKNREEFVQALAGPAPELVLSDYQLAAFDGLTALALVRDVLPDVPFILISGTTGEETVVDALKCGATDYVLKNHLERLEIVLARALHESRERANRLRAEAALAESQSRLQQSQKMEAMGRLSGGVAHDFNNILTAITGYTELALANPSLDAGLRADINEILSAAFRATALTRQLLAFSRKQIFAPKILDLNRTLADLDRLLQRVIREDIKMSVVPASDLLRVHADADQIGQVIMNLVVNARDAMPQGGRLILSTANVEFDEAAVRTRGDIPPGRFVRISVEDTGTGMDAETLSHIFEPFFTTKCKDQGTGLGLATVYGIVKQSNGFLEVDSRVGEGTIFHVHLPAVDAAADEIISPLRPGSLRGSETILVVDDDAAIGLITRRILESRGYTVIEARGGSEALRLCADPALTIDLLMSDVVMSGMNGPELARSLQAARPRCKALLVTGYAETGDLGSSSVDLPVIAKPFVAAELLTTVRRLLDQR
jgi:signal transduction histidine kinase